VVSGIGFDVGLSPDREQTLDVAALLPRTRLFVVNVTAKPSDIQLSTCDTFAVQKTTACPFLNRLLYGLTYSRSGAASLHFK
jgi:hypothetical protein